MKPGETVYPRVTAVTRPWQPLDKTPYLIIGELGAAGYMAKNLESGKIVNLLPEDVTCKPEDSVEISSGSYTLLESFKKFT
jgi:hypothetical protein